MAGKLIELAPRQHQRLGEKIRARISDHMDKLVEHFTLMAGIDPDRQRELEQGMEHLARIIDLLTLHYSESMELETKEMERHINEHYVCIPRDEWERAEREHGRAVKEEP